MKVIIDGKECELEEVDRPTEGDRLLELIDDQRHKIHELDSQLGRALMRLDALEKAIADFSTRKPCEHVPGTHLPVAQECYQPKP